LIGITGTVPSKPPNSTLSPTFLPGTGIILTAVVPGAPHRETPRLSKISATLSPTAGVRA